ncbi:WYL domain-containing protein [uncultured Thiodictyon sp.]|jgi:hypothetical protein|uniref:helix-turn-helix transcriptional regulator n=1 Tax=uncultured Thiodictyon sp. TaxID=1846217 RepID=UPI0025E5B858|nr:WYL domain-containing protein [uncultured Thiodictyon sp.]
MCDTFHRRHERLRRLESLLPAPGAAHADCPDGARLLLMMADSYGEGGEDARRRALLRDLATLIKDERIEAVNPGGKPLRFRRRGEDPREDDEIWKYALEQIRGLIAEAVPERRLDRLWKRLLDQYGGPLLDEQRLRLVPDTLRLKPVELSEPVLRAVIVALAQRCALRVLYEDAEGERGQAELHPQALVQRGPIPYLFALKNDESAPVRLYALHRMISAEALPDTPARPVPGFNLDQAIAQGKADFGQGTLIDLELRVRGYLAPLLEVCPLSDGQCLEPEPAGSAFILRVSARLPSTGQLLRWLLGAGDNLEVVAPAGLRRVVAVQAGKMAAIYAED